MDGTISLNFIWKLRLSLRAEGDKLREEGAKLIAEGDKLWAEGAKLRAEGDRLWAEAVIEVYGNVAIEWHSDMSCTVNGTEKFGEDAK